MSGTIFPDNRSRIFEGKRTIISSNRLICSNYVHLCTVDIDLRKSENAIGMLDLLLVILCTKSTTFSLILRLNPLGHRISTSDDHRISTSRFAAAWMNKNNVQQQAVWFFGKLSIDFR